MPAVSLKAISIGYAIYQNSSMTVCARAAVVAAQIATLALNKKV